MRFLADESCDFAVVRALRAEGHLVTEVSETARGASDDKVVTTGEFSFPTRGGKSGS